jgi:hypothetical protein
MKVLYEAGNNVEAHMILDLLKQEGLRGRIDGAYLQGGMGELPAAGLIRVLVEEEDYARAKEIVVAWDTAQPAIAAPPAAVPVKRGGKAWSFAAGLLVGLACATAYYVTPVARDGIDYNSDGVLDEKWSFSAEGLQVASELDRNLDGKVDQIYRFARDRTIETLDTDDNFDGQFETKTTYQKGNMHLIEVDTDKDSFFDLKTNLVNGVVVSKEFIYPTTGKPRKIDYFKGALMTHADVDSNTDGKMDRRIHYDALEMVKSVEDLQAP